MRRFRGLAVLSVACIAALVFFAAHPQPVAERSSGWPEWQNPGTKLVPIVALGTPGVQLGLAQVTGPRERLDDVKVVLQVEADFQRSVRARVFVPSREFVGLNRVQGVAVSALLQYGLFRF